MVTSWGDSCSTDDEEEITDRKKFIDDDDESLSKPPRKGYEADDLDVAIGGDHADLYAKFNDGDVVADENSSSVMNNNAMSSGGEEMTGATSNDGESTIQDQNDVPRPPRQYDFPTEPPYTAFVGNLAYKISEKEILAEQMINLAREKLSMENLNVLDAKIIKDRATDKSRGFGYIEVESLEILQSLMTLNEMNPMLFGRRIQLDTATQKNNTYNNRGSYTGNRNNNQHGNRNNNSYSNDDSRRRSGFNQNNHSQNNNHSNNSTGYNRRSEDGVNRGSMNDIGSKFRGGKHLQQTATNRSSSTNVQDDSAPPAPPKQRTPLNLLKRTKPLEKVEAQGNRTPPASVSSVSPAWTPSTAVSTKVIPAKESVVEAEVDAASEVETNIILDPVEADPLVVSDNTGTLGNNDNDNSNTIEGEDYESRGTGHQQDNKQIRSGDNTKNNATDGHEHTSSNDQDGWRGRSGSNMTHESQGRGGGRSYQSGGTRGSMRDDSYNNNSNNRRSSRSNNYSSPRGSGGAIEGVMNSGRSSAGSGRGDYVARNSGRSGDGSGRGYTDRGGRNNNSGARGGRSGGDERSSGRGGVGRNSLGGGRSTSTVHNSTTGNSNNKDNSRKTERSDARDNTTVSSNASTAVVENKKKVYVPVSDPVVEPKKKVVNKFEALKYDSDSD